MNWWWSKERTYTIVIPLYSLDTWLSHGSWPYIIFRQIKCFLPSPIFQYFYSTSGRQLVILLAPLFTPVLCVGEVVLHIFADWKSFVVSVTLTDPAETLVQVLVHNSGHGADTDAFHTIHVTSLFLVQRTSPRVRVYVSIINPINIHTIAFAWVRWSQYEIKPDLYSIPYGLWKPVHRMADMVPILHCSIHNFVEFGKLFIPTNGLNNETSALDPGKTYSEQCGHRFVTPPNSTFRHRWQKHSIRTGLLHGENTFRKTSGRTAHAWHSADIRSLNRGIEERIQIRIEQAPKSVYIQTFSRFTRLHNPFSRLVKYWLS